MSELLRLDQVSKHYEVKSAFGRHATLKAVDRVSLGIVRGETLALVGESGSGKTTTAKMALGLIRPSAGRVVSHGEDVADLRGKAELAFRRRVQVVFQDPSASLNPRRNIFRTLRAPMLLHDLTTRVQARADASELLERVGLNPASSFLDRLPHQLSGGQKQRVAIARALALQPDVIIADEPVSALDVSVRARILTLLRDIQAEMSLGMLLITHDLSVVRAAADGVAVMYLGRIMEEGPVESVFQSPKHPYTQALLRASPRPKARVGEYHPRATLSGEIPSPIDPPSGCRFRTRCPFAQERCALEEPLLLPEVGDAKHKVACHFSDELSAGSMERLQSEEAL